ncbi:hypothetical protein M3Y96_00449300 [Aphelenchoides besseyi]|nr:hypothetical protein M3Y96_00449300 [Aphelenchoides besseyi]
MLLLVVSRAVEDDERFQCDAAPFFDHVPNPSNKVPHLICPGDFSTYYELWTVDTHSLYQGWSSIMIVSKYKKLGKTSTMLEFMMPPTFFMTLYNEERKNNSDNTPVGLQLEKPPKIYPISDIPLFELSPNMRQKIEQYCSAISSNSINDQLGLE